MVHICTNITLKANKSVHFTQVSLPDVEMRPTDPEFYVLVESNNLMGILGNQRVTKADWLVCNKPFDWLISVWE